MESGKEQTVIALIDQIKASQKHLLKMFEEHNSLVIKSLEKLQEFKAEIKTETKAEIVKEKNSLEKIKRLNDKVQDGKYTDNYSILISIIDILCLCESDKISASFKEIFLRLFRLSLDLDNETEQNDFLNVNFNETKKRILNIRDIRWLLLEMEKYPQYFHFIEEDIETMKENGASRDNIYLVKRFLKKDGEYEDFYTEEEGGGIKCNYHMTCGKLNGEYKEWHPNGQKKLQSYYKDDKKEGSYQRWWSHGKIYQECTYKDDKIEGLHQTWYANEQKMEEFIYKEGKKEGLSRGWFQSGNDWYECVYKNDKKEGLYQEWCNDKQLARLTFYQDGKEEGLDQKWYWINGQKWMELNYKKGKQEGISQVWHENGLKSYEANYINGKLDGERKEWNKQGELTLHRIYKDGKEIEVII